MQKLSGQSPGYIQCQWEIGNRLLTMRHLVLVLLLVSVFMAPEEDLVKNVPGYPKEYPTKIYSGYLSTGNVNRSLHYVFVESAEGPSPDEPVTLWLNGGPGCSSMLGFIQEIGPYYLEDGVDYKDGDTLTFNPYSWHNYSHLLFIESPAGVGFSYNLETNFTFTNYVVATDTFNAVQDFFNVKFPEYRKSKFWISGESYAGIYIPDLATLIDQFNFGNDNPIDLRGILVGNGAMDFTDDSLDKSIIDFYLKREFVDPDLVHYWKTSCQSDEESAGCQYFLQRFENNTDQINPYSVYDYCSTSVTGENRGQPFQSQTSLLRKGLAKMRGETPKKLYGGAPCLYFDGVYHYFNLHDKDFHAKWEGQDWNGPCASNVSDHYRITASGSMNSYKHLLARVGLYQIVMYNGNWDAAVPYVDTIKNLEKLGLTHSYLYTPYHVNDEHAGFVQLWNGVTFFLFKGASHMVPQTKRAAAQSMFKDIISGHNATETFMRNSQM